MTISWRGGTYNFHQEALNCAINEACGGEEQDCNLDSPCAFCKALTVLIEKALIRAFLAGRDSKGGPNETGPDDEGGSVASVDPPQGQREGRIILRPKGPVVGSDSKARAAA